MKCIHRITRLVFNDIPGGTMYIMKSFCINVQYINRAYDMKKGARLEEEIHDIEIANPLICEDCAYAMKKENF